MKVKVVFLMLLMSICGCGDAWRINECATGCRLHDGSYMDHFSKVDGCVCTK